MPHSSQALSVVEQRDVALAGKPAISCIARNLGQDTEFHHAVDEPVRGGVADS